MSEVVVEFDVEVPSRDGTILRCNIARPAGEGTWPVVVGRTPYGKDGPKPDPLLDLVGIAREGFVAILQDVRCRFRSGGEGEFVPFVHETKDGEDLIAWAAALPYSTGDVFMLGSSYMGFAQWTAAVRSPRALRAIAPGQSPSTPDRTLLYRGEVLELSGMVSLFLAFAPDILMRRHAGDPEALGNALTQLMADIEALPTTGFASLPLRNFEPLARNGVGDALFEMLPEAGDSNTTLPTLKALRTAQSYKDVTVPALIIGGWYDFFCQGAIDQFIGMRAHGGSEATRERTRLIVGPWTHASQSAINGERYFGLAAAPGAAGRGGLRGETLRFFREQLPDAAPPPSSTAPVKIFIMGANVWRDEWEWPLERTQPISWYLSSGGHANTLHGDGRLGTEILSSPPDHYTYDPAKPAPTWGGCNVGFTELAGPRDQRGIESRNDVVVYTSDVLTEDLEVTGTATIELWVLSTARVTDFVVRLVDVLPDGTAYNIAEGVQRIRDHPVGKTELKPIRSGQPTQVRFDLTPTSNLFKAGSRLRVDITSSSFPRWERCLNTGNRLYGTLAEALVAHQQIWHDETYPSRIIMPVIPN